MASECSINGCCYPVFRTDKNTRKKYCSYHWKQHSTDIDKRSFAAKHIEKMQAKNKENGVVDEKLELDKWFEEKMKSSERVCENCGASLKSYNKSDWKGSMHHILEKSLYDSVKTHPDNHLVLCKWKCHMIWHQSWEKASQMRIFPKAISIIEKLYPLLPKEERRKLPEIILQELNSGIA